MDESLNQALQKFLRYHQAKKQHHLGNPNTRRRVQAFKQAFLDSIPEGHDPQKLLKEWEATFHDLETKFHHQGG